MNDIPAPLVSVVVPAYNAAPTIAESIDSALRQTFGNFELLVVDDGSDDATAAVVAGIADPRVRCESFANAGPSAARNRGVERTSGKFVAFLDADDLWLPGKLAAQVEALEHNPDAALAFSWSDSIDESGAFLKKGHYMRAERPGYEQLLLWNFLDNGSTPLIRRDALADVGVFDEELRYGEDWDMWLRLAHRYPLICVREVHVLYRVGRGSASSNVRTLADGTAVVLQRALDRLPPGRDRERLGRTAMANLYQTLAMRLVETSASRRTGLEAVGYWWRYLTTTPNRFSQLGRIAFIGGAVVANLVLPRRYFERLRRRWSRVRGGAGDD